MSSAFERIKDTAPSQPGVACPAPKLLPDAALPQLDVVRDVTVMRCVFQSSMFAAGARYRIEGCTIMYIHYWPGEACSISYRIAIRDVMTGQDIMLGLSARVLPPGLSESLFSEASRGVLHYSPLCDPVLHLSDLGMVVWLFPNDPKLDGIPALIDEIQLRDSVLPRLVAEDCGSAWTISDWHTEVVSHVPEQRCTLRVMTQLRHSGTGELQTRTYYGKAYPDQAGRITKLNMESLRKTCAGSIAPFCIARPLLYQEESKILWQTGFAGTPLAAMKVGSEELLSSLAETGRVIATLHDSSIECPGAVECETPLQRLARALETLSHAEHRSTCLPARLVAAAHVSGNSPRATVHRDLHLKNILSTSEGIALIDYDNLAVGDTVEDMARFVAHLCSLCMGRGLSGPQIEPMIRALVHSYSNSVLGGMSEGEFRWHLAAALLYQQACRCITRPMRKRLANLNKIIEFAELVADGGVL